jgi:hypothetical protein
MTDGDQLLLISSFVHVCLFDMLIKLSLERFQSGLRIVQGFKTSNDKVSTARRALALQGDLKMGLFHPASLSQITRIPPPVPSKRGPEFNRLVYTI